MRVCLLFSLLLVMTISSISQSGEFPRVLWVDGDAVVTPRPTGSPAVQWDATGLSQLQAGVSATSVPDTYVAQLTRPNCLPCVQQWSSGQTELKPLLWSFGPAAHFRQEYTAEGAVPRYELRQAGQVIQTWPSGTRWSVMAQALRKALDDPVVSRSGIVGFISLGSVPAKKEVAALLQTMKPLLGQGGSLQMIYRRQGQLAPLELPELSGMSLIIPEQTELTWTMPGESLVINASQPLVIQTGSWLAGSIRVQGLTIGSDRIVPAVPGIPDPIIRVTE